ncbi:effector-associated domain EAD1-containing protein [Leptolyngbya sp. CCNP1308]|uniref:effector-associated domain EAD1-containing protein n=1 Tax=Leptolyngbya sp. CCNP1308 TaxID=3110255 RepID=UPI002B1F9DB4|nr:effector-associated domain EAD1-containing protein [Leptolyngbya sp. CCNP1308]MEA5452535.1 effector-associated domain EAD1-containing protein [Leptolyngbya sp. CCNP1308]
MTLDNPLRKLLFQALLSAFPQVDDLVILVDFELGENLWQIVGEATGQSIVYKLIVWCEAYGRLKDLIEAASRERPKNPELCHFVARYQQLTVTNRPQEDFEVQAPLPTTPAEPKRQSFPEACHFDMDVLMEECREAIYGKKGLVGLIVPCSETVFQEYFCERLRQNLGRKATKKRQPLAIDVNISAEQVVSRIRGFKSDLLKDYDVICPLPIHISQPGSTLPDSVWQALSEEFKNTEINRRLIVVMFGGKTTIFPKGPIYIQPPLFKEMHIEDWVIRVSKVLEWPEHAWEHWKIRMVLDCFSDPTCQSLDIWKVYERLELSLKLLQNHRVADDFLQELVNELQLRGYHV